MGENTKIEWAHHTMNFWIGCTPVSGACDHCYAQTLSERYGWAEWGASKPRHRTSAENWKKPLAWDRKAAKLGERHRVFSNSLSDWADKEVPDVWRDDSMKVIEATPNLDWLLLTKRGNVMAKYFRDRSRVPANVWPGVTAETQGDLDARLVFLMGLWGQGARRVFLSMEPLLERVVLSEAFLELGSAAWVIVGGESGNGARPMHPDWARSLRDQCRAAGVPFLMKQWGEWAPYDRGRFISGPIDLPIQKFGKKLAGRLLDGIEHNGVPATKQEEML